MLGRKLLLDTSNRSQWGPSHGNEFPWTRLMDVSVLFWHCHILNFQLQINVIKSDDKPRVGSHLMLFQQILSLKRCLGFETILQTIARTSMNLISTLSVSSFSLTCSWDILSLAVISTSLWWAPRISSLLKVDVFEHVSLSLHSLSRFAFKERIF